MSSDSNEERKVGDYESPIVKMMSKATTMLGEQKALMEKVSKRKRLDLGVPGGYEQFNYKEAFKLSDAIYQVEAELKDRMKKGLMDMINEHKEAKVVAKQR